MSIKLNPIEAYEHTIGQLFTDSYEFEIPAYQRPYAWEEEQVSELLNDLFEAMDDKDSSGGVYFLGSVVLIKQPGQSQSRVIDGQQRLTSLTILLSVLRDLTTNEEKRFERRAYVFQKASEDKGTTERFRLLLRAKDRPFFRKHVQEPGATKLPIDLAGLKGSQFQIAANTRYFREQLEQLDEARRDSLVAFIVQRCYLVVVAVPTAETARRIFTVLNARGLDLTATDILKADLLDRAGEAIEASLAERWEAVELALGRDGLVELFGHIRMIFEREKPRLALEVGFPKFVSPFSGDPNKFVTDLLEPLSDAATLIKDDAGIRKQYGAEAAKAVRSLLRIDSKDWVPPVLLKLWKRKEDDKENVAEFLVSIERLAYYLFVTRSDVNERITRFASVLKELDDLSPTRSHSSELSEAEQAEFIEALDGPIYLKTRICKPVLQRLDEALSTGGASYDDLVSIEHVLPQTVDEGSEWATLFPDERVRADWTHKLANLVFLTHRVNTRASNWDFDRKKKEYFSSEDGSSPFVVTQEVLRAPNWSADFLETRQRRLLEKLAAVWSLDVNAVHELDDSDGLGEEKGKDWFGPGHPKLVDIRESIVGAVGKNIGKSLEKISSATFQSSDGQVRAVCTMSKRYRKGSLYWYGYAPRWDTFLSGGDTSFFILGMMDRDAAYALPHARIKSILTQLHRTPERHWHIAIDEDDQGVLCIVPAKGPKFSLKPFEIKFEHQW